VLEQLEAEAEAEAAAHTEEDVTGFLFVHEA
jgi:hypothetical protein